MQPVYLGDKTEFGPLGLWEIKNQNKYGTMYGLNSKIDLISTEFVGEYHVFRSENGKTYLCIKSDSQMGLTLLKMQDGVTKEKGFAFKPAKKMLYIRMTCACIAGSQVSQPFNLCECLWCIFSTCVQYG